MRSEQHRGHPLQCVDSPGAIAGGISQSQSLTAVVQPQLLLWESALVGQIFDCKLVLNCCHIATVYSDAYQYILINYNYFLILKNKLHHNYSIIIFLKSRPRAELFSVLHLS